MDHAGLIGVLARRLIALHDAGIDVSPLHAELRLIRQLVDNNVLEEAGEDEPALAHYRRALTADPLYPDLHINLALLYEKLRRERQAAEHCGFSKSTFEKMRLSGTGPRFIRRGTSVFYDLDDLTEWLSSLPRFSSTAEADAADPIHRDAS